MFPLNMKTKKINLDKINLKFNQTKQLNNWKTGAGKTTLIDLFIGIRSISGEILIDNHSLKEKGILGII